MTRAVLLGTVLLLLALAPPAQAAINGDHPYEAMLPYQDGLGAQGGSFTLLSGSMEAIIVDVRGPYGIFQSDHARLEGLTRVCFAKTCLSSPGGNLAIDVAAGGSFGLKFPHATSAKAHADHVLGLLVDFEGSRDLNTFTMGKTLMAPSILGSFDLTDVPAIPTTAGIPDAASAHANAGGLVGLDAQTVIQVLDGSQVRHSFAAGKTDSIAFQGSPRLGTLHPGLMLLPFEAGSSVHMEPAAQEAADVGLDLARIATLGTNVDAASKAGVTGKAPEINLGPLEPLIPKLLNGAVLRLPAKTDESTNPAKAVGLVRFGSLDVQSNGSEMAVRGEGPLTVQDGEVAHASPLIGFAVFQLPWWSYLLWMLAIGVFVARLVVKPPKEHPVYDRYRWVGIVCSVALFILFFILWDMEVKAVWGVSLLDGSASGEAALIMAAIELGPMFAVMFAVITPIRVILKNSTWLMHGGRFMGLPGAFAYPFGYILGAPLLLAYLNVGLKAVAGT
ncbi:MAG TPA: hypothetical protein VM286_09230 [Candidatus Thermoplasmatota archaeon]|nr:hypothetical protein [Candidatus Thermoplasmatota archaeon]